VSTSTPVTTAPAAILDLPTTVPGQVAKWRGSSVPDKIDSLLAAAFSAKGEYTGDEEEYAFSGSESAVEALRKIPDAIPRLVECLGWDERAAAEFNGSKVLVGVVCYQAILGSEYNNKLNNESAFPVAAQVEYSNPSIDVVRKAQSEWRKVLTTHPPQANR